MTRRLLMTMACLLGTLALTGIYAGWLPAAETTKKIRVECKRVLYVDKHDKKSTTTLSGARIFHEDAIFAADTVVVQTEDGVNEITCTGNPVYTDPEARVTATKVVAYSTPRRAEFTQNVKLVSTPKKKAAVKDKAEKDKPEEDDLKSSVTGEPTTITCNAMSYDYANKRSNARGNVIVIQKRRTVWADKGIYDQAQELITLTGNVRLKNAGDEELKELKDADTVTVTLENDWVDIVAKPDGVINMFFDVKDDQQPAKPGEKK
jgi:lipopolysaccharide export system protein LptA